MVTRPKAERPPVGSPAPDFCECDPLCRTVYVMPTHNGTAWYVCEKCGGFVEQFGSTGDEGNDDG